MRGDSRNRRAAASAGMGVTQRLVQVGCTLILMPVLMHALGPARFGVWGAAASLAWVVGCLPYIGWNLRALSRLGAGLLLPREVIRTALLRGARGLAASRNQTASADLAG